MNILRFASVAASAATSIFLLACDPLGTQHTQTDVKFYNKNLPIPISPKDTLKVMTYNIKFGGGRIDFFFDCFGDRVIMDSSEVTKNLEGLAQLIRTVDPDILFLQEADVQSKRSAYIDQVEYILQNTQLQFACYASQWKGKYIPSKGLGRMNSGSAILSKYPVSNGIRHALPLIKDQNPVIRYFYLQRNVLECTTQIGNRLVVLLNTHTEAYAQDGTKARQLDSILNLTRRIQQEGKNFILAGDFNTLPPKTLKTKGFPDSVCKGEFEADDFSQETALMQPFYDNFQSETDLALYHQNNDRFFTHSVDKNCFWNRKLDYIFTNLNVRTNLTTTWQSIENGGIETMQLSDHCPVSTIIVLPPLQPRK